MEYLIGLVLTLAIIGGCIAVGLERDRAYYPLILIVIAFYYVLFAAMDPSGRALVAEIAVACVFSLLAVLGFKKSMWLVAGAFAAHGAFDLVHHLLIDNAGVPHWWPGFCLASDVVFAAVIAVRVPRHQLQRREI